mgnify:CR=1 FL=1
MGSPANGTPCERFLHIIKVAKCDEGVTTIYQGLANAVAVLHLLLIIYGLLGGLLALWRRWALAIHFPLAVWVSAIEFTDWVCPLTPLEKWLRESAGAQAYSGGFVEHYLLPVIYPPGLTPQIQIVLGLIALGTNLLVYGYVFYRWRAAGRRP